MKNNKQYNIGIENVKTFLDSKIAMYLNEISEEKPLSDYKLGLCGGLRIAERLLEEVVTHLHKK